MPKPFMAKHDNEYEGVLRTLRVRAVTIRPRPAKGPAIALVKVDVEARKK